MAVADLALMRRDLRVVVGGVVALSDGPAAFMSYVRFNDAHDDGQLSQFRERLAAEVRDFLD